MQVTNTTQAWINQLNHAVGIKIEELIAAETPSFEAHDEMRGFFDQLYIDLYNFEACAKVRKEVIEIIQELDTKLCVTTVH